MERARAEEDSTGSRDAAGGPARVRDRRGDRDHGRGRPPGRAYPGTAATGKPGSLPQRAPVRASTTAARRGCSVTGSPPGRGSRAVPRAIARTTACGAIRRSARSASIRTGPHSTRRAAGRAPRRPASCVTCRNRCSALAGDSTSERSVSATHADSVADSGLNPLPAWVACDALRASWNDASELGAASSIGRATDS